MIWWLAVAVVLIGGFALLLLQDTLPGKYASRKAETLVAIELHRIRRRFDVADIRTEQRQDMARLRREIGDVLDGRSK